MDGWPYSYLTNVKCNDCLKQEKVMFKDDFLHDPILTMNLKIKLVKQSSARSRVNRMLYHNKRRIYFRV